MPEANTPQTNAKRSKILAWFRYIQAKIALKTAIAAVLSLLVGLWFADIFNRPDTIISGLWCVVAAIVVMQAHLGGTYQAAWTLFLGVLVGSIAGAVFSYAIGGGPLSLGISIFCTIVICSILNIKNSFRIASMSTAVVVVFSELRPNIDPWLFALFRFLDFCIGIMTSVLVAYAIWPEKAIEQLRSNVIKTLGLDSKYYRLSVDFNPENAARIHAADSLYLQIDDLAQKYRANYEDAKLEVYDQRSTQDNWGQIISQLDVILESITTLRYVHKDMLNHIFDDSLAHHVESVVDETDLAFQALESMLAFRSPVSSFDDLEKSLANLNQDLLRFRGTHTIRKFNLEDVESFFVFFYHLRLISEALKKMEAPIRRLFIPS